MRKNQVLKINLFKGGKGEGVIDGIFIGGDVCFFGVFISLDQWHSK